MKIFVVYATDEYQSTDSYRTLGIATSLQQAAKICIASKDHCLNWLNYESGHFVASLYEANKAQEGGEQSVSSQNDNPFQSFLRKEFVKNWKLFKKELTDIIRLCVEDAEMSGDVSGVNWEIVTKDPDLDHNDVANALGESVTATRKWRLRVWVD